MFCANPGIFSRMALAAVLVAAALSCGDAAAQMPGGVLAYQSGGTFTQRGINVTVPSEYRIIDVKNVYGRLLLVALLVSESSEAESQYQSEVWMFRSQRGESEPVEFEDRVVLATAESSEGEQQRLYSETFNCPQATAVYVKFWEGGGTRLFDAEGNEIKVDWAAKRAEFPGLRGDYVRPLGWLESVGRGGVAYQLVCELFDEGGSGSYLFTYDLATGEITIQPTLGVSNAIYWQLIQNMGRWQ